MKTKKLMVLGVIVLLVVVVIGALGLRYIQSSGSNKIDKKLDSDHDGLPDYIERTLGTNPYLADTDGDGMNDSVDPHPTYVNFQVNATTGPVGFKIEQILVENNIDPVTNKAVGDHLELSLHNLIGKDITNMSVFYRIIDNKTGQNESYLVQLTGFVLKSHTNTIIHFDNAVKEDHFTYNPNSMYYRSKDQLYFGVLVNTPGYTGQTTSVTKDAGGAEQPD